MNISTLAKELNVKISVKEGKVIVNGVEIGKVEKGENSSYWYTNSSDYGHSTRLSAIEYLVKFYINTGKPA